MRLEPGELLRNNYILLDSVNHKELLPFIRTYLKKWTIYTVCYYLSNLILLVYSCYLLFEGYGNPDYNLGPRFRYYSFGLAGAFLLVPVHEYIHGLAYKSQGAKNTSYSANLKKFYFLAIADHFVANKREFEIVALAPFLLISLVLVTLILITGPVLTIVLAGTLLMHTAMCSGDFGMVSYFRYHHDKDIVTFDDKDTEVTYFYYKST